ncbi:inositol monophosphatase family protein [Sphingomonas faeni]|uniref:Inositol monophosphatase family protein n=1 Tax=Sphingomonas faeni TaxID=185950 RepID=A0A2T5U754_9SPHN|nr:aldo/keto reductase [Sphingomonas faeni]PTW47353.1 inositol monophosphatase family protein [Sphingomonas faeni]
MKYKTLGNTGLFVSELCLGTMTFGGRGVWANMGNVQLDDAQALIARALDHGINFIDTADIYSAGASEEIIGQSLSNLGVRREDVVIATKVCGPMGTGPNDAGNSRAHIFDSVRASLKRLQVNHIDLYQLHNIDTVTPIEESLDALDTLVRQGLVPAYRSRRFEHRADPVPPSRCAKRHAGGPCDRLDHDHRLRRHPRRSCRDRLYRANHRPPRCFLAAHRASVSRAVLREGCDLWRAHVMIRPNVAFLHRLADLADAETMPRYRADIAVDIKVEEGYTFYAVTEADRAAEVAIGAEIGACFPDHAILGEELGLTGSGRFQWVLDPVDGTRPFICGLRVWGTLIGRRSTDVPSWG